ncbi:MAG: lycopene cyclase [Saprospiraceae bacterium]|nr:lycopene cyclase [Saprospiraceae bacterium]
MNSYDVVIAGAGLAGLTLARLIATHPELGKKRVLIIDRDDKNANDRTWCFWARDDENMPAVSTFTWNACKFYAPGFERRLDIAPYRYHMVRGCDFYAWSKQQIATNPNIIWLKASILNIDAEQGLVTTDSGDYTGEVVFNSALMKRKLIPQNPWFEQPFSLSEKPEAQGRGGAIQLLQHFKGWLVETEQPVFDPECVTFMDFRVDQNGATRFVYVLPFSPTRALVEYTLFSPELLKETDYDDALKNYLIQYLNINQYQIEETEFGIIPMTDAVFPAILEGRVINIGTAGGFVKGSSGYAFKRTQRKLQALVNDWGQQGAPNPALLASDPHFRFFDSVLLKVLQQKGDLGGEVFKRMFRDLPATTVFRFLDEDSTLVENLRVMATAPKGVFTLAAFKQMTRLSQL